MCLWMNWNDPTSWGNGGLAGWKGSQESAVLQSRVDRAVTETLDEFSSRGLRADQLAMTCVDLTCAGEVSHASHRGNVLIYPASVVKLFYLVAAHRWIEDRACQDSPELQRALRDMVVDSSNEATHYVVDLLTDTTSGPELPEPELKEWFHRRNSVTRYFQSLGYPEINVNKKPWHDGPYGREMQAVRSYQPSCNWLSTDATARLLVEITTGKAVNEKRSRQMLDLMQRDIYGPVKDPEDQTHGFTGIALLESHQAGTRLWSKAGWTSRMRHDAAYMEFPDGRKIVLILFTLDHAKERRILPALARRILWP